MQPSIHLHNTQDDMAKSLARTIQTDLSNRPKSFLILPGGNSPLPLIKQLAFQSFETDLTISTTDERCVPKQDPQSNLGQIKSLTDNMNAMYISLWPFENSTSQEDDLETIQAHVTAVPDIVVLGMGEDGHIASIFPQMQILNETQDLILVEAPKPPSRRVSFKLEYLLQAERLILLVSSADKWQLCQAILSGEHSDLPVAKLLAQVGQKLELHSENFSE